MTISIAVHFGSLLAVIAALWPEWWLMFKALIGRAGTEARQDGACSDAGTRLLPVAAVGFLFKDWVEAAFSSPYVPGIMLLVTGVLLWYADSGRV